MADNTTLNTGSGGDTIATDDIAGVKHQRVKIQYGVDGSATDVSDTNPLPIDDAGGSITVDNAALSVTGGGTEASAMRVTLASDSTGVLSIDDNGSTISVDDGGGALTVDGTVTANLSATDNAVLDQIEINTSYGDQTGGGVEASALRVTLANDSTGVLSVDDNGGSLTVDGTVAATQSGTWNVNNVSGTVSLPTGAATSANQSTANTALAAIQTAVEILDNIVSGSEAQVDIVTQPARAATTDTISAKLATDAIQDGTTALTPKFAAIDAASSGDNTLVAAVVGKKIRVLSLFLVAAGTVTTRFEDGAGGTALTGQMNVTTNSGFSLPFNPVGWFETSANTLLNLELSGAVSVDGCLTYVEV